MTNLFWAGSAVARDKNIPPEWVSTGVTGRPLLLVASEVVGPDELTEFEISTMRLLLWSAKIWDAARTLRGSRDDRLLYSRELFLLEEGATGSEGS